jgi:hypothetical protein
MKRRAYLRLLPAAAVTGVAGCSSSDDSMGDNTDADGDAETTTAEPTATPEESVEAAAAALTDAAERLDTESNNLGNFEEGIQFSEGAIRDSITEARGHLDVADGGDLSEEQQETVEEFRMVANYIESLTDTTGEAATGLNEFSTALEYLDSERFEDAIDAIEDSRSHFGTASDSLSETRSTFDELGRDSFDPLDTSYAETQESLDRIEAVVETMDPYLSGYREYVRGYDHFQTATTDLEAERFEDAADEYATAAVRFDDSASGFEEAEDTAPPTMLSDIVQTTCYAQALRDGSEYYAAGSRAYARGDEETGRSEFQDGQEAFNRCESSTAATLRMPAL